MGPDAPEVIPRSIEEQVTDIQQPGGEGRALFEKEDAETLSVEDQLLIDALNVADGADVVTSVDGGLEGQIAERLPFTVRWPTPAGGTRTGDRPGSGYRGAH